MQDQRILDNDDVRVFGSKAVPGRGGNLKIVDPFTFGRETDDGWQIQNSERLKKKLKRTMLLELSRKDAMPDERAKTVRNVWNLNVKDRWRLYRRWLMDVAEEYRRTISLFQEQFEEGAKRLKDIKDLEDLEILKKAHVVGMTTTALQSTANFCNYCDRE
ncbi:NFX1-type zinc finger-containing protein 1 [Desmophyllum pertusum]|uniref:NFX1-type zinc finger-containing protein 1 n=1 Tax=Desmophyllum pertusum TaxID=174260 RepID=A0A9W9YC64_9CNID|nr:NFX1-type zinc finger-containing protein 1 [Desmophyllum pertusum]